MTRPGARPSERGKNTSEDILKRMRGVVGGKSTDAAADPTETTTAPEPVVDDRPAARRRSDSKRQQGINWDTDLLLYSRDVVDRFKRAYPEEHIPTLAALVDVSVRAHLTELERKYNAGRAFPPLV